MFGLEISLIRSEPSILIVQVLKELQVLAIHAVDQDVVVHMVDPDAAVRHGAIVVIN